MSKGCRDPRERKHQWGKAKRQPDPLPPERNLPETLYLVRKGTPIEVRTPKDPTWHSHIARKDTKMHTTGRKGEVLYLRFLHYEVRLKDEDNLCDQRFPRYEAPKPPKFAAGTSDKTPKCELCRIRRAERFVLPVLNLRLQICEVCRGNIEHISGKLKHPTKTKVFKKQRQIVPDRKQAENAVELALSFNNPTLAKTISYAMQRQRKHASRRKAERGGENKPQAAVSPAGSPSSGVPHRNAMVSDESPRPRPEGVFPAVVAAP